MEKAKVNLPLQPYSIKSYTHDLAVLKAVKNSLLKIVNANSETSEALQAVNYQIERLEILKAGSISALKNHKVK